MNTMRALLAATSALLSAVCSPLAPAGEHATPAAPTQTEVFVSGRDGVHTYRIPALVVSPQGTLLVFCEARKQGIRDADPKCDGKDCLLFANPNVAGEKYGAVERTKMTVRLSYNEGKNRLSIDRAHVRVAGPGSRAAGDRLVQQIEILPVEMDLHGGRILLQVAPSLRARDRHDLVALGQDPG